MPKSKNKRKNGKKRRNYLPFRRASATPEPEPRVSNDRSSRLGLREILLDDYGAGLVRFALYFPLLTGAWCASGLVLNEVILFAAITAAIAISHFHASTFGREDIPFKANLLMVVGAAQVALVLWSYHLSKNLALSTCLASVVAVSTAEVYLKAETTREVLMKGLSRLIRSCLYALLGVLSQVPGKDLGYYEKYIVYGVSSGLVLFAYTILRERSLFLSNGWLQRRLVRNKDDQEVQRPGSFSQFYSILLLVGPAFVCAGVPFGVFPGSFLVMAGGFLFLPKLAEIQFEEREPLEVLCRKTAAAAGGLALLSLLGGMLARFGIY